MARSSVTERVATLHPRLRVRPRPQWCRRTVMMPRGRSGGHEDAAVGRGVAIIRKHEPSVTRRRHHRWPAAKRENLPVCRMRPQTCSATSLDTHRRALSRRPAAFFLATWTFLRHDSWAATYVYLHSTTATTATARSAEENFGASRAAAGVDAVVSQLGRGGAPLRFPAVGRKSLSRRTCKRRTRHGRSPT